MATATATSTTATPKRSHAGRSARLIHDTAVSPRRPARSAVNRSFFTASMVRASASHGAQHPVHWRRVSRTDVRMLGGGSCGLATPSSTSRTWRQRSASTSAPLVSPGASSATMARTARWRPGRRRSPFASHEQAGSVLTGGYRRNDPRGAAGRHRDRVRHGRRRTAWHRALEAGAVKVTSPQVKPWGQTVAYVRDPEGMLVEICTPVGG